MRADSFINAIIYCKSEGRPTRVAPGSRRDVMHRHYSFGGRGQLAVEQIQGERFGRHFVPVFIHPQNVLGK